jgi:hypothetical protein
MQRGEEGRGTSWPWRWQCKKEDGRKNVEGKTALFGTCTRGSVSPKLAEFHLNTNEEEKEEKKTREEVLLPYLVV